MGLIMLVDAQGCNAIIGSTVIYTKEDKLHFGTIMRVHESTQLAVIQNSDNKLYLNPSQFICTTDAKYQPDSHTVYKIAKEFVNEWYNLMKSEHISFTAKHPNEIHMTGSGLLWVCCDEEDDDDEYYYQPQIKTAEQFNKKYSDATSFEKQFNALMTKYDVTMSYTKTQFEFENDESDGVIYLETKLFELTTNNPTGRLHHYDIMRFKNCLNGEVFNM